METDYSLEIQTPSGEPFDEFSSIIEIDYARSINQVGTLSVRVPAWYPPNTIRRNMRILAWRRTAFGTRLAANTIWMVRKKRFRAEDGTTLFTAEDPISLLGRRIVAYKAETSYADKTLEVLELVDYNDTLRIDNMMRAYVRENFTAAALDATRDLSTYFSVQNDLSLAPHSEKTASFASVLQTLQDLARVSEEKGMYLAFDVIPGIDTPTFFFKVFYNNQGTDRGITSEKPLVFSRLLGNLTEVEVEEDYSAEGTACYVLGFGSGPARVFEVVKNEEALRADPFNLVEFTAELSDVDVSTVLIEEGRAALQGRKPKLRIEGRTIDTGDVLYGRDYDYGDKVVVQEGGVQMNAMVSALHITMSEGRENREIRLSGEAPL